MRCNFVLEVYLHHIINALITYYYNQYYYNITITVTINAILVVRELISSHRLKNDA